MQEQLLKIKNKLIPLLSFKKINPHNHWKILLYLFFILVSILILFSFYLFYEIKNQQIFQVTIDQTGSTKLVNEKLLNKVDKSFESKSIMEKEIKSGLVEFKDPSIN